MLGSITTTTSDRTDRPVKSHLPYTRRKPLDMINFPHQAMLESGGTVTVSNLHHFRFCTVQGPASKWIHHSLFHCRVLANCDCGIGSGGDLSNFLRNYQEMRIFYGICALIAGLALWILAVVATVSWLVFCFGSVIIGILLLIFAPYILFAPMAFISTPGTSLLMIGMDFLANEPKDSKFSWRRQRL